MEQQSISISKAGIVATLQAGPKGTASRRRGRHEMWNQCDIDISYDFSDVMKCPGHVLQIYCYSYRKSTLGIFGLSRHIPYLHILHLLNLSRSTPTMIINVTNIAMETLPFADYLLIEDPGRNLAFSGSLRRGSCGESH